MPLFHGIYAGIASKYLENQRSKKTLIELEEIVKFDKKDDKVTIQNQEKQKNENKKLKNK